MGTPFTSLSREGKLAKMSQHVDGGHPVPSEWVQWLVTEFVPAGSWPKAPGKVEPAFHDLDHGRKLEKVACHLQDGLVPSPWVEWLMDEYVASHAAPPEGLDAVRP